MKKLTVLTIITCLLIAVGIAPYGVSYGDEAKVYSVDRCENNLFFRGHDVNLTNRTEGKASVGVSGDSLLFAVGEYLPFDAGIDFEDAYLEFWLYLPDPTSIGNSAFNVNSSGDVNSGKDQITFGFSSVAVEEGWNYISFPFSSGMISGNFDIHHIEQIRYYAYTNRNTYVLIDDIIITDTPRTVTKEQIDGFNKLSASPVPLLTPIEDMTDPSAGFRNMILAIVGGVVAVAGVVASILIRRGRRDEKN